MQKQLKILIICPHPERQAPGQRLKYEQYFNAFRTNGYALTVSPFFSPRVYKVLYKKGHILTKTFYVILGYYRRIFDLLRAPFYDGVFVFLWATPVGPPFFESLFRKLFKRLIYDIDDLVFLGNASAANWFMKLIRTKSKYVYLMRVADHVITCTPYLDSFVRQYNTKTTDISSTINTDTYVPKHTYVKNSRLVIGWSGSVTTAPYLHLLDSVFYRMKKSGLDFELLVIGEPNFQILEIAYQAIPWKETTEVEDLSRIDIGVYPLPNDQWVMGKSGLKALQYMALGIPTVATAIGANFRVIEDGISGFLVETEDQWVDKLTLLLNDEHLRSRIGQAARVRVEKYYSVKANIPVYLNIFKTVYRSDLPVG